MSATRLSVAPLLFASLVSLASPTPAQPTTRKIDLPEISHGVDAGNLTIYWLLWAKDELAEVLVGLEAALAAKTCKITEQASEQVASIDIRNKGRVALFLQAGVTLKGGKQDRTLASDVVIPPLSTLAVPTYCIEKSRWTGSGAFGTSDQLTFVAPSRGLKIFAQYPMNHQQQAVWNEVDDLKRAAVKAGVLSKSTSSSLNEELEKIVTSKAFGNYTRQLESIEPPADTVGLAVVISGRVANIDIYGHRKLFRQQWTKLRNSAAFEALIHEPGKGEAVVVKKDEVVASIRKALAWWRSGPKPHQTRKTGPVEQRVIGKRDGARVMFDYVWSGKTLHAQIVFPEKRGG